MQVRVKAWKEVLNPSTGLVYDDEGLEALDAIRYGKVYEVEEMSEHMSEVLVKEFEADNPEYAFCRMVVEFL